MPRLPKKSCRCEAPGLPGYTIGSSLADLTSPQSTFHRPVTAACAPLAENAACAARATISRQKANHRRANPRMARILFTLVDTSQPSDAGAQARHTALVDAAAHQ